MRETHFIAVAMFVAYLGVAVVVENLYPFSTFPMYSKAEKVSGARLVALDKGGAVHEVTVYKEWNCPDLQPIERVTCADGTLGEPAGYLAKEATDYMRAHWAEPPAPNAEPVELVIRVWVFPAEGGQAPPMDCPIRSCSAVRDE